MNLTAGLHTFLEGGGEVCDLLPILNYPTQLSTESSDMLHGYQTHQSPFYFNPSIDYQIPQHLNTARPSINSTSDFSTEVSSQYQSIQQIPVPEEPILKEARFPTPGKGRCRAKSRRVKTGCLTCRQRRVKVCFSALGFLSRHLQRSPSAMKRSQSVFVARNIAHIRPKWLSASTPRCKRRRFLRVKDWLSSPLL